MARDGDWVGDIGHLALADSALSEVLIDMLRMLNYGNPFVAPSEPDTGLTTKQAANQVLSLQRNDPRLFPEGTAEWLDDVLNATGERNKLVHAAARNRCIRCGTATLFQHPRTGQYVDRSEGAIQALTEELLDLHERGGEIAAEIASLVNDRSILAAMILADEIDETIVPNTVQPLAAEFTCGDCNGDGRATATMTVQIGSIEVEPTGLTKRLREDMRKRKD